MNTTEVWDLLITAVSFRSAWDINRACNPMWLSPMSPSSSAFGVRAATLSMTATSIAPLRTRYSTISKACSAVSGCAMSIDSMSTPHFAAYSGSSACSASIYATVPPSFWADAAIWKANVVFPADSAPNISMTRPRGTPPMPNAKSSESDPVGNASYSPWALAASPRSMIAPLPKSRSILSRASSRAFCFSAIMCVTSKYLHPASPDASTI